ncbi:MAG: ATP-binding cassette domain-containing protein [Spirochaetia bacterium]|jgi:iron complex transport system ATP-binding protein
MNSVVLQATGLCWRVGKAAIVDGIDISIGRGELVGVIGPNGAGKTTLLRLLAGLLPPSAGKVTLDGVDITAMESRHRARRLSFMSQDTAPAFPFTVREILLMGRYPHLNRFEQETADDHERARRMLSYVGLSGVEDRGFSELSGGERQLVLFAKALVQDTETLVLDEPSSSLDIRHQDRIFSMAQELARENRAVVTSVHNLGVAAQYCSRLVLLEKGRVAAEGRAEQVLRSDILDRVYGVRTLVSPSMATGSLTVAVIPQRANAAGTRVHLIGGAGSAVNLTRELYRLGCILSGGIAHEHDSDEKLWRSLGIEHMAIGAFSRITDEEVLACSRFVQEADITILCSFPVGQGNLGNLKLAALARNLVVLKSGPQDAQRGFLLQEGKAIFNELCAGARILLYEEILSELEQVRGNPRNEE